MATISGASRSILSFCSEFEFKKNACPSTRKLNAFSFIEANTELQRWIRLSAQLSLRCSSHRTKIIIQLSERRHQQSTENATPSVGKFGCCEQFYFISFSCRRDTKPFKRINKFTPDARIVRKLCFTCLIFCSVEEIRINKKKKKKHRFVGTVPQDII